MGAAGGAAMALFCGRDELTDDAIVHVIDDDDAVRGSLGFLLDCAGLTVRAWESAEAFVAAAGYRSGGCVLSDVRMPGLDGLALQHRLRELGSDLPLILMTGHGDVPMAVAALKAGAVDFLEKPFDDDALLAAVRAALARGRAGQVRQAEQNGSAQRLAALTPRERQVLDGLVAGLPNKTIAYDLGISARTVEVHRARVMQKTAARNLPELVRLALAAEDSGQH